MEEQRKPILTLEELEAIDKSILKHYLQRWELLLLFKPMTTIGYVRCEQKMRATREGLTKWD